MSFQSCFLAAASAGEVFSDAFMTIIIGLVVVFAVLLLLTGVFKLFGVVGSSGGKKEDSSAAAPAATKIVPASVTAVPQEDDDEIAAVIAAAVAAISQAEGKQYAVRSIRRKAGGTASDQRPVWSAAGLTESTRPF